MPPSNLREVISHVLPLIKPSLEERKKVLRVLNYSIERVKKVVSSRDIEVEVVPLGSVPRDTWLAGSADIDIFLLFPKNFPENLLGTTVMSIAREAFGSFTQRYAEHPYTISLVEGVEVELVPAYRINPGEPLKSKVDRTPLHHRYLMEKLDPHLKDEVRLLKSFAKAVGVYGAESKIEGFSGYLTELLILSHGGFEDLIRSASSWREPVYIDIEKNVPRSIAEERFEGDPLIVIDPVDPNRNVAAPLSRTQFYRFTTACRALLLYPTEDLFAIPGREKEEEPLSPAELRTVMTSRGTDLIVVVISEVDLPPEIMWTQAKALSRRINILLKENNFKVIWCSGWTDEKSTIAVAVELESSVLPKAVLREGPRVNGLGEEEFLKKYSSSSDVFSGPYIHEDRWYVVRTRRGRDAVALISSYIHDRSFPKLLSSTKKRIFTQRESRRIPRGIRTFLKKELVKREPFTRFLAEGLSLRSTQSRGG